MVCAYRKISSWDEVNKMLGKARYLSHPPIYGTEVHAIDEDILLGKWYEFPIVQVPKERSRINRTLAKLVHSMGPKYARKYILHPDAKIDEYAYEYYEVGEDKSVQFYIRPNTKIKVSLDYDGDIGFKEVRYREIDGTDNEETYPHDNAVFNSICLRPGSHYVFEASYPEVNEFPSLEDAVRLVSPQVRVRYPCLPTAFNKFSEKLKSENIKQLVDNIYDFVTEKHLEDRDDYDNCAGDIKVMLHDLEKEGGFYGDCKAVSTFVVALANSLGLPARRIECGVDLVADYNEAHNFYSERLVQAEKDLKRDRYILAPASVLSRDERSADYYRKMIADIDPKAVYFSAGGHSWAEIYVPLNDKEGTWLLCDPAMGFKLNYPAVEKGVWYRPDCHLPRLMNPKAKSLRLMVSYEPI